MGGSYMCGAIPMDSKVNAAAREPDEHPVGMLKG